MPNSTSVKRAHDALLAEMPEHASHDDASCPLCQQDGTTRKAEKEVAHVPDDAKNVYTEDQHFALVTAAVDRETAALSTKSQELETQVASLTETNTTLQSKIDVLEGEKASESARAEAAEKALVDFKAELAEKAAIEARKADRVTAIKAANGDLADEYFTDERAQRWAEMADEAFEVVLEGLREAATASAKKAPAAAEGDTAEQVAEKARETAAFTGGTAPTSGGAGSTLGAFLTATGHLPAAKS